MVISKYTHTTLTHRASSLLDPCASGVRSEELGWVPGVPGGRQPHSGLGPEPGQGGGDPLSSRQGHPAGLYVCGLPISTSFHIPLSVRRIPLHCIFHSTISLHSSTSFHYQSADQSTCTVNLINSHVDSPSLLRSIRYMQWCACCSGLCCHA